jgi:hypothetical protein
MTNDSIEQQLRQLGEEWPADDSFVERVISRIDSETPRPNVSRSAGKLVMRTSYLTIGGSLHASAYGGLSDGKALEVFSTLRWKMHSSRCRRFMRWLRYTPMTARRISLQKHGSRGAGDFLWSVMIWSASTTGPGSGSTRKGCRYGVANERAWALTNCSTRHSTSVNSWNATANVIRRVIAASTACGTNATG